MKEMGRRDKSADVWEDLWVRGQLQTIPGGLEMGSWSNAAGCRNLHKRWKSRR